MFILRQGSFPCPEMKPKRSSSNPKKICSRSRDLSHVFECIEACTGTRVSCQYQALECFGSIHLPGSMEPHVHQSRGHRTQGDAYRLGIWATVSNTFDFDWISSYSCINTIEKHPNSSFTSVFYKRHENQNERLSEINLMYIYWKKSNSSNWSLLCTDDLNANPVFSRELKLET